MLTDKPKPQMTPQRRWTQLVRYLKDKDKALAQQMRQDAPTLASPGVTEAGAIRLLGKFSLIGQILDRVEQLERGMDDVNDSPHRAAAPMDEPY